MVTVAQSVVGSWRKCRQKKKKKKNRSNIIIHKIKKNPRAPSFRFRRTGVGLRRVDMACTNTTFLFSVLGLQLLLMLAFAVMSGLMGDLASTDSPWFYGVQFLLSAALLVVVVTRKQGSAIRSRFALVVSVFFFFFFFACVVIMGFETAGPGLR